MKTVKVPLFADDMILYFKDPKKPYPKTLSHSKSFSNAAEYKINLQKSLAFLYNNEQIEKEYIITILFTIASKKSNT
jgi:hypothetical protein